MGKRDSIRTSRDFRRVYERGRRARRDGVSVVADEVPSDRSRLGLSVRGPVRGAVARNRIKRRLRAAFRACDVEDGRDVVIVAAAPEVGSASFQELVGNLQGALDDVGASRRPRL